MPDGTIAAAFGKSEGGTNDQSLALLTPAQRGLVLAIIQADRNGRGGRDLEELAKPVASAHDDVRGSIQLTQRLSILEDWQKARADHR
jgi:hypothetical protein